MKSKDTLRFEAIQRALNAMSTNFQETGDKVHVPGFILETVKKIRNTDLRQKAMIEVNKYHKLVKFPLRYPDFQV